MLTWHRMGPTACRQALLRGTVFLACCVSLPVFAASLREEAITYRSQGYEAQRRGDRDTALTLYRKAAALDPTYATPLNDAGVVLEETGRLDEAEQVYQQSLKLNPNYLEPHANLAMLYERKGEKEKAIYHWLKRLQLGDPYDPWTARAEERLIALGALRDDPGLKGKIFTRRRIVEQEFQTYDQDLEEFRAVTKERADVQ